MRSRLLRDGDAAPRETNDIALGTAVIRRDRRDSERRDEGQDEGRDRQHRGKTSAHGDALLLPP